ncbi:MAG: hypothetical protein Q3M24_06505 [Candidatus Electrothrix aestuarii]|uniref:GH64 domain-containing protein n=1 Tax=Candidatus Electrothrix aestuarii TaxID=3062594 RepID=A0AAU8LYV0_9BACT|nr:beta-1,3-glucanase family protein [Candidatus Electrothrix aestuarii]
MSRIKSSDYYCFQIVINGSMPGTKGDKIYACGTVNTVGDGAAAYFEWQKQDDENYQVALKAPSNLERLTTSLSKIVTAQVNTKTTETFPPSVKTTITQSIPYTLSTKVNGDFPKETTTFKVNDASGVAKGMTPSGGMLPKGDAFRGKTTVTNVDLSTNKITVSHPSLVQLSDTANITFTSSHDSTYTIKVASVEGIRKGMKVTGGKQDGTGFNLHTLVVSTDGEDQSVTLNKLTIPSSIDKGAPVVFSPNIPSGKVILHLKSVDNIEKGMLVSGGADTGSAFPATSEVVKVDATNKTVTASQVTKSSIKIGTQITFTPATTWKLEVAGKPSKANIMIPNDQLLAGGRIIFSVGDETQFSVNSNNKPVAPVPYAGTVVEGYYDFIEFAWTPGDDNLNFDTSIVDQYGLPICISFDGQSQSERGVPLKRSDVFDTFKNFMTTQPSSTYSASSPKKSDVTDFFKGLAEYMTPYRILAPADAFLRAQQQDTTSDIKHKVNAVSTYFDTIIQAFFDQYDPSKPLGASFVMQNVPGCANTGKCGSSLHDLQGSVTTVQRKATNGTVHTYRVLKIKDITPNIGDKQGKDWEYTIFEPFFSSNGYTNKPLPPHWLNDGQNIPTTETPTQMVFGASGVFADSAEGNAPEYHPPGYNPTCYQTLLGAIENQIVTAISRGIALASQWRWLYQSTENPVTPVFKPQVTVNPGNTLTISAQAFVPVFKGMSVQQTGSEYVDNGTQDAPNVVTDVSIDSNGTTTITLLNANVASHNNVQVIFSYENIKNPFYQLSDPMTCSPFDGQNFNNEGVWNYFAQFFHQTYDPASQNGISIKGLAYAYAFDDQGNFSTDISMDNASSATVKLGTP